MLGDKQQEIYRLARAPPPAAKAIIRGGLSDAQSGKTRVVISPIDGATIAPIPNCGQADVDRAVAAAQDF